LPDPVFGAWNSDRSADRHQIGSAAFAAQQAKSAPVAGELAPILAQPASIEAAPEAELIHKRFELIKQVVPGSARVGVLWQPRADSDAAMAALQYAEKAASATGVSLQFLAAGDFARLEAAFSEISTGQVNAILVMSGPMLNTEHKYIVESIAKTRLPAIYDARVFVVDGGLMSYGPYLNGLRSTGAPHLEKILDNTNPTDLAVEQPTKFEFIINLNAAKALGLSIPPSLLARADEVIE
jgi:putative ABC transport system substrate-binding protein